MTKIMVGRIDPSLLHGVGYLGSKVVRPKRYKPSVADEIHLGEDIL